VEILHPQACNGPPPSSRHRPHSPYGSALRLVGSW
jgi:hypothetical protein